MNIEIFGTPTCSYCTSAKTLLDAKGIQYAYTDFLSLGEEEQHHVRHERAPNAVSFPIIFIDDIYIGGFSNLSSAF